MSAARGLCQQASANLAQGKITEAIADCHQTISMQPDLPEAHKILGDALLSQGKLNEAQGAYTKALEINPNFAEARANLGTIFYQQGKLNKAIDCYQQAIKVNPNLAIAQWAIGNVLARKGKQADALEHQYKALTLQPELATAEIHNSIGMALAQRGRLDEAHACYRRAIGIQTNYVAAYENLIDVLNRQGRFVETIEPLRKVVLLQPGNIKLRFTLGGLLIQRGELDEAVELFQTVLQIEPNNAMAYCGLGIVLAKQNKQEEAILCFESALQIQPRYFDALFNLGIALTQQNRLDEAIASFEKALGINPKDAGLSCRLGLVLEKQGKIDEAIASYRRAIDIQPNYAPAYVDLINILTEQNRFAEAIKPLKNAIQLQPDNTQLKCNLGEILIKQGELDAAAELFQAVLRVEPINAKASCGLGIVLVKQDKLEDAIPNFEAALQIDPKHFDSLLNLGIVLTAQDRLDEAIAHLQTAVSINSQHGDLSFRLGIAFMKQDNHEAAIAYLQRALEIDPNHFDSLLKLCGVLISQKSLDEAISYLQTALSIDSQHRDFNLCLGIALMDGGNHEEAIPYLQRAIEIDPEHFESLINLGIALASQNRLDEAISYFQTALSTNSENADINFRLGTVLMQQNKHQEAIPYLARSLDIKPTLAAYSNLISSIQALLNSGNHFHVNAEVGQFLKQSVEKYSKLCDGESVINSLITTINAYLNSGCSKEALTTALELESYVYNRSDRIDESEVTLLYTSFLFAMFSLRDDRTANSRFAKLAGSLYVDKIINPGLDATAISSASCFNTKENQKSNSEQLRIGILSKYMCRHSVGWCSVSTIQALACLTPHVYLYSSGKVGEDEITQMFKQTGAKFYLAEDYDGSYADAAKLLEQMSQDRLDILVELDSLTAPLHLAILHKKPASVCLSWLGFDAPYISSSNYFLGDWYTHPEEIDPYYVERVARLPNSHMAVAGFNSNPVDRDEVRQSLGIASHQVAYLHSCHVRKLNKASIKAHVQILKQVPDSVLLRKGRGTNESIKHTYEQECQMHGVDVDRIKFLPMTKSEEDHRMVYPIADVLLDSYPYNGGSQNLEALWFNLPVVTLVGEQSFARMGYSFLQTLGIEAGIARNWEEYVDWGAKLGLDRELRDSVREQLIRSKQPETLSPLWNPAQLAQDMYAIFEELVAHANRS